MKSDASLFGTTEAEARSEMRAEADIREGRLISHRAVRRWLASWASAKRLARPAPATDLARIVWTEEAVEHLEATVTYVSVYDPAAAARLGHA